MPLQISSHVEKLHKYQPFDADSGDLVFESQSSHDQPMFPVATRGYLGKLVLRPTLKTIVLTGDAGHGKTSLCAALLEDLGDSQKSAAKKVEQHGEAGASVAGYTPAGRPIYLLKDLSNFDSRVGAEHLTRLLEPEANGIAIICANEGQLRNCVAADPNGKARVIVDTLGAGLTEGRVLSPDSSVAVINLNYQSVAPDNGKDGLLDWSLKQWATDKRSWQQCKKCDAKPKCPIWTNHELLGDGTTGPSRRGAMRDIFAAAERTGAVITARQALSVVAYSITGGLKCAEVHQRFKQDKASNSWQSPYLYHQALFGDTLSPRQRQQVPAILALRKLDPGRVSRREVDDNLEPDTLTSRFLPPQPTDAQPVRTTKQQQKEAEILRLLYAFLRRLDYFDGEPSGRYARLGLNAGDSFGSVQDEVSSPQKTSIRDLILKGLEAAQGIHRVGRNPDFLVLDPAFFAHRAKAAVVAQTVTNRDVILMDQLTHWIDEAEKEGTAPEMHNAVDWLNRSVFIRIPGQSENSFVSVELNLLRFELLTRWAGGLRSGAQHEAEIRGLTNALSGLSIERGTEHDIQVLVGSTPRKLMIDVGNQIRSVRS